MTEILDMSQFVEAKSDQLNADDLIGGPRTVTITRVVGNGGDQPVSIHYEGDGGKPFKPCKTIRRVMIGVWGKYANEYIGKSMTLYRDDKVTFGGLETGGIRISHMSGIEKDTVVVVMKTKGKKAGIKIQPLRIEPQEDAAAGWVRGFKDAIDGCATEQALDDLLAGKGKRYTDLETRRPELFVECVHAIDVKRASFSAEKRSDDQFGDQFGGDDGEAA